MFPASNYMSGSFFNDIIYTTTTPHFSKQQEDPAAPFCFFHMPSPYNIPYHDQELELQDSDDLLLFQQDYYHHHQQHQPLVLKNINEQENNVQQQHQDQEPNSQSKISVRPPKRSFCKRDRHSKINTAQGPRDRRVRLSLKVARDFFDLQDQLGFDKASKTVEWLLLQAKPEVKKIFCNNNGIDSSNSTSTAAAAAAAASSASDCEPAAVSAVSVPIQQDSYPKDKPKRTRMPRKKTVFFDPVAREESREKARARARERTREKIKSRIIVEVDANHEHVTMTSTTSTSSPSCETGTAGSTDWPEESAGRSHHSNMILQQLLEQESGTSEELNIDADESLMMMLTNNHLYNLIHQDQHQFPS